MVRKPENKPVAPLGDRQSLIDLATSYAEQARAKATMTAYQQAWRQFLDFCEAYCFEATEGDPEVIALFLAKQSEAKTVSTLRKYMAAIQLMLGRLGVRPDMKHPDLAAVWSGICRVHGRPTVGKAPLREEMLRDITKLIPLNIAGHRDRALLTLGFQSALRRSELVSLNVEDITITSSELVIQIERSKTDQYGQGREFCVDRIPDSPLCPARALEVWIMAARLSDGPLFRPVDRFGRLQDNRLGAQAVSRILKKWVANLAKERELPKAARDALVAEFGAHSLRSGFVTEQSEKGVSDWEIMKKTGHQNQTSLSPYRRKARRRRLIKSS